MSSPSDQDVLALNRAWVSQQLLRGIAHDCRNHLQIVALGSGEPDGGATALGRRLDQALDGITAALDLLSQLGRPEAGDARPTEIAVALERLPALADLQRNYPARPVVVTGSVDQARLVDLSSSELTQLLLNLVAAAKSTAGATAPVTIAVRSEAGQVILGFADPGLAAWVASTERPAGLGIEAVAAAATKLLLARAKGRWNVTASGGVDLSLPATARY